MGTLKSISKKMMKLGLAKASPFYLHKIVRKY